MKILHFHACARKESGRSKVVRLKVVKEELED